jgi:aspartyl/glutamyl-tRNA(Asn/Gln) amidotransferase C subunit
MTGINDATIQKLAKLARLALDDAEVRALAPELARIVASVDAMRAVATDDVAPMIHGHPPGAELAPPSPWPDDVAVLGRAAVEQSAGLADDGSVKVGRVIDEG